MLGILIHFGSRKFDITQEPPNDINPIPGQSFLAWLRPRLEELGYGVEGPSTEDWGWYLEVQDAHARHMVGACAIPGDPVYWIVQVRRWRTLREWLFRTARPPGADDPLVQTVFRLVHEIAVDPDDPEETFLEVEPPAAGFWESFFGEPARHPRRARTSRQEVLERRKAAMPADVLAAHPHCSNHRVEIAASTLCGCFYCLAIFPPSEIDDWVDEGQAEAGRTALCPKCGIDSVLGDRSGFPMHEEFLAAMKAHWF